MTALVDIVVPTAGRPSLCRLLDALEPQAAELPGRVLVVDDRGEPAGGLPGGSRLWLEVVRGPARGPAAARNAGWRRCNGEWIAFLDDDVVPGPAWVEALIRDLRSAALPTGGVQGRVLVPLPSGRPSTDAERGTAALQGARWATADMAYRRSALLACGGFDERFPRAYREDADLALRIEAAGYSLTVGSRRIEHPPHPESRFASVRRQRGNADDALMRALHGRSWRRSAGAPRGALRRHLAVTAAGAGAAVAAAAGRRRPASVLAAAWAAGTAAFAAERIAAGPALPSEVVEMAVTSVSIPPAAVASRAAGEMRARRRVRGRRPPAIDAVLLDRDGTLIVDVPYNGDPARVTPIEGVAAALHRLRREGLRLGVVTNQSGIGRGLVTSEQVEAVNREVDRQLGPFDVWMVCPHAPWEPCDCRKPMPGMVEGAARHLGVPTSACAFIGDTGADVEAARRAGAHPVLVPNDVTLRQEIAEAPRVAPDLGSAVRVLLGEAS